MGAELDEMEKFDNFYVNIEEILSQGESATELNNLCKKIVKEANESLQDDFCEHYKDQSILNSQVVGAEYK